LPPSADARSRAVLVACLFPGAGYDSVLATAFGLPGLKLKPGAGTPTGPALSQARKLLGEQAMKRIFELDAAVPDAELGIGLLWKGLAVTAIDGTTIELGRNDVLEGEFGTPAERARPVLRVLAHVRTATFRWIGAAIGGYHDGENALADQLEDSFRPGMLNLADRGFFSMHRWIRFSAAGAHLAWRIKNGAKSVPLKTVRTLPDGFRPVFLLRIDERVTRPAQRGGPAGNPLGPGGIRGACGCLSLTVLAAAYRSGCLRVAAASVALASAPSAPSRSAASSASVARRPWSRKGSRSASRRAAV
jgi:Insertion element 4 transposase N-terminal